MPKFRAITTNDDWQTLKPKIKKMEKFLTTYFNYDIILLRDLENSN
jgi:hypothetical protein